MGYVSRRTLIKAAALGVAGMAVTETITIKVQDREGNVSLEKKVPINWKTGFEFGVTVGANDARWLANHSGGGTPEALQFSYNTVGPAINFNFGQHVKFFGDHGINDAQNMWNAWPGSEPAPLLTNEVWDQNALDLWMNTLNKPVHLCYLQEFMDKVGGTGQMTWTTFNNRYAALRQQIDNHPNGHFVLLRYVGNEAKERQAATPIWQNVEVQPRCGIGNDTYITQLQHFNSPIKAFKGSVDWYNASKTIPGVRLMISESGISRVNFPDPSSRATALQAFIDYLTSVAHDGVYNYWATDNSDKSPEKDWSGDKPGDEVFAAKISSLVAA